MLMDGSDVANDDWVNIVTQSTRLLKKKDNAMLLSQKVTFDDLARRADRGPLCSCWKILKIIFLV